MKKIVAIGLFIIIYHFSGTSQEVKNQSSGSKYSSYNLMKASPHELNTYLKKAKGQKTTGMVMTLTGTALVIIGVKTASEMSVISLGVIAVGLITPLIGIPLWATGSNRKRKVNEEFEKRARLSFEVAPNLIFVNKGQNPSTGATLRISF